MRLRRALAVTAHPELQVVDPVVRLVTVLVMHRLDARKFATEVLGHDDAMLKFPRPLPRLIAKLYLDVPVALPHMTATLPVPVTLPELIGHLPLAADA
jgi:hypothetical protein